jgi:protein PhnA
METKDCNGNTLNNGDVVMVNKTLDVKGSPIIIKKGTKVKNIRLTDDPNEVDCKVNGTRLVLKTMFLKKK